MRLVFETIVWHAVYGRGTIVEDVRPRDCEANVIFDDRDGPAHVLIAELTACPTDGEVSEGAPQPPSRKSLTFETLEARLRETAELIGVGAEGKALRLQHRAMIDPAMLGAS
jgi:hypothetical protein